MHCLETNPPEINIHKFRIAAKFETVAMAQSAWRKISKKMGRMAVCNFHDFKLYTNVMGDA